MLKDRSPRSTELIKCLFEAHKILLKLWIKRNKKSDEYQYNKTKVRTGYLGQRELISIFNELGFQKDL